VSRGCSTAHCTTQDQSPLWSFMGGPSAGLSSYIFICIVIYICTCVCIYVYVCVYIHKCTRTHKHKRGHTQNLFAWWFGCIYMCLQQVHTLFLILNRLYVYVCIYVCISFSHVCRWTYMLMDLRNNQVLHAHFHRQCCLNRANLHAHTHQHTHNT